MKRQTAAAQRPANGKRQPNTPPREPMAEKDANLERAIGIKKKGMGLRTWMKIDQTGIPEVLIANAPRVRMIHVVHVVQANLNPCPYPCPYPILYPYPYPYPCSYWSSFSADGGSG